MDRRAFIQSAIAASTGIGAAGLAAPIKAPPALAAGFTGQSPLATVSNHQPAGPRSGDIWVRGPHLCSDGRWDRLTVYKAV